MVSRGMLTTVSLCRPGEMCTSMIVSVLLLWSWPGRRTYCWWGVRPVRLSSPYTRRLSEFVLYTGGGRAGAVDGTATPAILSDAPRDFTDAPTAPAATLTT